MQLILHNKFRRSKRLNPYNVRHRKFICCIVTAFVRNTHCDISISFAFSIHSSKQCVCGRIPRKVCKLINRCQNDGRTLVIDFFINKIYWNTHPFRHFVFVKNTIFVFTVYLYCFSFQVNIIVFFF